MQKPENNWQRLEAVIHWSNLSINGFARAIGLPRGENLYQIRRGNNGISKDVAHRVATTFPEISEMWLLTGVGQMFSDSGLRGEQIPLFRADAEEAIAQVGAMTPDEYVVIPSLLESDLAMLYLGKAMQPQIPVGSLLFLKRVAPEQIMPGGIYLLRSGEQCLLRRVRTASQENLWRLEADAEGFDDWHLCKGAIHEAWRVKAHLTKDD